MAESPDGDSLTPTPTPESPDGVDGPMRAPKPASTMPKWLNGTVVALGGTGVALAGLMVSLDSGTRELVDSRIDGVETLVDSRIDGVETLVDSRIDGVETLINSRIDGVETLINSRIDDAANNSTARSADGENFRGSGGGDAAPEGLQTCLDELHREHLRFVQLAIDGIRFPDGFIGRGQQGRVILPPAPRFPASCNLESQAQ